MSRPTPTNLFRNWKLGEAKKNNGVLLLVAPTEHKVRIEVGYGLEGTLTDALSSVIISSAIVPRFKANDFSGGIERGVDGIINVLSGDTADWQPKPSVRAEDSPQLSNGLFSILFLLFVIFVVWSLIRSARSTSSGPYIRRGGGMIFLPTGGSWVLRAGAAGLVAAAADSVAASLAAAVGRVAEARREAGDGSYQRRSRGHLGCGTQGGEANLRTDRLRARSLILGLHICPDPMGECARAPHSMAVDRFYAIDRAADFPAATRGFHLSGFHFLAASPHACAARLTARPSAPGGA